MSLPTPNLDNRTFQDIVNEAKSSLSKLCPGWIDHNVSDPGVTLVELFAWMTEMILYRLNLVPDKHYIKLLELLGLNLQEPEAARTELTFYLSAPQTEEIIRIPARTEVATKPNSLTAEQGERQRPIVFQTDEPLLIYPARLIALITERVDPHGGSVYRNYPPKYLNETPDFDLEVFSSRPNKDDALYFGFEHNLSRHLLELDLACRKGAGEGIVPTQPPWQWEVWYDDGTEQGGWQPVIEIEADGTGGLNDSGKIWLRLPEIGKREVDNQPAYWLRCRLEPKEAQAQYSKSPWVSRVSTNSLGGFVKSSHAAVVYREMLGRSDGTPGQVFYLEHKPILRRERGETVQVRAPGQDWEPWQEVPDFANSTADDKCFTCDGITGEIRFGPALRQQNGTIRRYGAVPPRGAEIRFSSYRYGGGIAGNVQAETLTTPKTAIPYVDKVTNRRPAEGGRDPETIEQLKMRALELLRTRDRAVTPADYEVLLRRANFPIRRICCLPAAADSSRVGQIELLLVPEHSPLQDELRREIEDYLEDYRLLTVRLNLREPAYLPVVVELSLIACAEVSRNQVEQEVKAKLNAFLNPITGGPNGYGWPFGRPLYTSDIYTCLRDVSNIEFIESVRLFRVEADGQRKAEAAAGRLDVPADSVIISGKHEVTVRRMGEGEDSS